MKKGLISLILAFALSTTVLTGCGGNTKTPGTNETKSAGETGAEDNNEEKVTEAAAEESVAEKVTFLLPITYFCEDETQEKSTQEQLDAHSKDGLKYEFTDDDQILCTVVDSRAALAAARQAIDDDFAEYQDPDGSLYVESYLSMEYNEDITEIKITCNKESWSEYDGWWGAVFLNRANAYQQILGWSDEERKCVITFVDEDGEELAKDDLAEYK